MNKSIFTKRVRSIIETTTITDPIFVFLGINEYIEIDEFKNEIYDYDTFIIDGNENTFNQIWFAQAINTLLQPFTGEVKHKILSYAQISYIGNYMSLDIFANRLVVIRDNLRSLLPLGKQDYIERSESENLETRPEHMPVYMAEQRKIGDKFYYSYKSLVGNFKYVDLWKSREPLSSYSSEAELSVIDSISDPFSIDCFVNSCLEDGNFCKKAVVKHNPKHPQDKILVTKFEILNSILQEFGGEIFTLVEQAITESFTPSEETLALLKRYWGDGASFRNLSVYKNPAFDKTIISISQALIVETIIQEYNNARNGKYVKDLFLTAPTGAGKSLLFQLPAFYVSSNNDVTIVVSPLIALMKDQVGQIFEERGFEKVQYLNSELSLIDRDRIIQSCKNGEIDILYLSPELLLSYDISFFIGERKLGLLVVDEAHLITTWGRDFRVDYWFLGQYIDKMRKYHNFKFPMVAVTATAIYGGDNDMVFDSISSLYMHDPHVFIGEVKRNDISFLIDNHDKFKSNYDAEKEKETVAFIKNINELGFKSIVYAPYRSHIERIQQRLIAEDCGDIAVSYHSGIAAENKAQAYDLFRTGQRKVMVCTKAFGMGVDIPDIEVVYHHAPSGLLPDYIQEIGRAARAKEINGVAALSYALEDQRYSKTLYGMSSLKQYQLQEILNKIHKIYLAQDRKRNLLVSTDDFAYLFNDGDDVDQKVTTALMMIEKDYLAKYRFNVLIARPKRLFVKVYAYTNSIGIMNLKRLYPNDFKFLYSHADRHYIELNLDNIWQSKFSDKSFPLIKRNFYNGDLLANENIDLHPQVKLIFNLENEFQTVYDKLESILNSIKFCFNIFRGSYFTKKEFISELNNHISNKDLCSEIVDFILSSYSGRAIRPDEIEAGAFLQRKKNIKQDSEYRVFNSNYNHYFNQLLVRLSKLFKDKDIKKCVKYASTGHENLKQYIRLGSLLEIMGLMTFESRGGDNPMIFIRINDPLRIQNDINSKYENILLKKTMKRHSSSTELFDHFFLHTFDNEQRWNFIEDFFLGASNDDLLDKYPGTEKAHIDIIRHLKQNHKHVEVDTTRSSSTNTTLNIFTPVENDFYTNTRLLTIGEETKTILNWIKEDPVEFDKVRRKYSLRMEAATVSKLLRILQKEHFEYIRDLYGLRLRINFPGYTSEVEAKVVYDNDPVKFYKWWKKNNDKVYLSKKDMLMLFVRVNDKEPSALLKVHKDILTKKKF